MDTNRVAGVVGLQESHNNNGLAESATIGDPAETAGNPIDCRTSDDPSIERNALLDAREKAQALVRIRPDLRFIGADIVRLLDAIQKCPGDIFARRQLAERYATIGRRLANHQ